MARYIPGNVADPAANVENQKIAQAMDTPNQMLMLAPIYAEPSKFREGSVVYADGTTWDPGSGKGPYCYNGSAWVFLG